MLAKLTKVSAKALAAVMATVVACYIVLLLLNLNDQAPSAAAKAMQQLQLSAKPAVEQTAANNVYLYLAKHDAPAKYQLAEPLAALMRQCDIGDCHTMLLARPELTKLIAQHQAVTDFYQHVRSLTFLYHPIPADAAQALPSFHSVFNGQRLLLLQAWLAAQRQDTAEVKQLLEQDLQFWRALLLKNNLLLYKMVSAAAIKKHFKFAAYIKQQLAPEQASAMSPSAWLSAFTEQELSLQLAVAGEWAYGNMITDTLIVKAPQRGHNSLSEMIEWYLLMPLFQPQATSNQRAAQLLAYASGDAPDTNPWYSWFYNPVGKILNSVAQPDYERYRALLAELESLRQQATAATASQTGVQRLAPAHDTTPEHRQAMASAVH